MGHEKEGKGNEFEFSSSSRSLGLNFLRRGGGLQFISCSRSCRTVSQQVRQACMTRGGTVREQFKNSSRTKFVISSRTVEE